MTQYPVYTGLYHSDGSRYIRKDTAGRMRCFSTLDDVDLVLWVCDMALTAITAFCRWQEPWWSNREWPKWSGLINSRGDECSLVRNENGREELYYTGTRTIDCLIAIGRFCRWLV